MTGFTMEPRFGAGNVAGGAGRLRSRGEAPEPLFGARLALAQLNDGRAISCIDALLKAADPFERDDFARANRFSTKSQRFVTAGERLA